MRTIIHLDLRAFLALYGGAHGAWGPAMVGLTLIGTGWSCLALVPMFWHTRTRRFAGALAMAIAVQAALVWVFKLLVGRVRPWIALGLPEPIGAPQDPSFPSGHAAGSFCVAAFVALALPIALPLCVWRSRAVAALALLLATFVAFSRVYLGAHFPGDIVGGALLGALVGAIAAELYAISARARAPIR
jgi:undecaprenyl-diphosphatase